MGTVSDLSDALEKMYADLFKGINDLFPLRPQQVPPAYQAKVHIPPIQSGFLVPPAFWEQIALNSTQGLGRDPFGVAWTRRQEPNPLDAAIVSAMGARKLTSYIDVPNELLMADGLIPDTRPPRPPTPWRYRLRSKISDWREQAARIAYKAIAGQWPYDGEDDW